MFKIKTKFIMKKITFFYEDLINRCRMSKTKLLYLTLFLGLTLNAQIPQNGFQSEYLFNSGSLNESTIASDDFIQTVTGNTATNGIFSPLVTSPNAINLNQSVLTRPQFSADEFSISFWIKTATNDANTRIIFDQSEKTTVAGNTGDAGWFVFLRNGKIRLDTNYNLATNSNNAGNEWVESTFIADNTWHHVVLVAEQILAQQGATITYGYTTNIYTDGVTAASQSVSTRPATSFPVFSIDTPNDMVIAKLYSDSTPNNQFLDDLDNLRFYSEVLTQTEINQLYNENACDATVSATFNSLASTSAIIELGVTTNYTTWNLYYTEEGQPFSNGGDFQNISNQSQLITGLLPETTYDIQIVSNCALQNNTTFWTYNLKLTTTKSPIYVDASATSGNNTGTSWDNAYVTLINALASNVLLPDNEIWVAAGTYTPAMSDRNEPFYLNQNNLKLLGGFNGTEIRSDQRDHIANPTILSGDLNGNDSGVLDFASATRNDNSYTVLALNSDDVVVDGFTISGGFANGGSGTNTLSRFGAGIFNQRSGGTTTINNCIIRDNMANDAAAGYYHRVSSPTITNINIYNTIFENNISLGATGMYIYTEGTSLASINVENCLFDGNISKDDTSTSTTRQGFSGSSFWLRALSSDSYLIPSINNNTFVNNLDQGTLTTSDNQSTIVFTHNSFSNSLYARIVNTIFFNNKNANGDIASAISGGTSIFDQNNNALGVFNTIDEDNLSQVISIAKINVITANPLFTDFLNGDYSLQSTSPAVDEGDNSFSNLNLDLSGNPRIVNNTVDLGAYEYTGTLSIDDNTTISNDFKLYPNPVKNILNIKTNAVIDNVEVYSVMGQKVMSVNAKTIDVSQLKQGIYLLKIEAGDAKYKSLRFIKH